MNIHDEASKHKFFTPFVPFRHRSKVEIDRVEIILLLETQKEVHTLRKTPDTLGVFSALLP